MFSPEKKKKSKSKAQEWEFDIEKELGNPVELRKRKEGVQLRVQELKSLLRQGEDKKLFEETQTVLNGLLAAQKVIGRLERK